MKKHTTLPRLSSLYQAVDIRQEIAPLIIGERTNPTGSKKFRELLLANDFDGCLEVAMSQEKIGAHVLDLSAAWAGRNEEEDMVRLVQLFSKSLHIPLMIDSTSPVVIESALKHYPGRPVINSINFEDGGENLNRVCQLARKYGAAVVALTIDEDGMAMDTDKKLEIAKRIYEAAVKEHGLSPFDIFFDPLTFTVGSGDETLRDAAIQTLRAISRIKEELQGCNTILGLSNISFGLPPAARRILNAVFLHEAVEAGLDSVIINPSNCISLDGIDLESRKLALGLLYDKNETDSTDSPLMQFIEHFEGIQHVDETEDVKTFNPEQQLFDKLLHGNKSDLPDTIQMLLDKYSALEIINQILVPAMKKVGDLFGAGEMLLPFVLKSAEVMKASVDLLEPYMDKSEQNESLTILLATVRGDVHDIGKNLVNIIFSNNGYNVIDLGIKVSAEKIIEEAKKQKVDVIGLSGLLVKSAIIMKEEMKGYRDAGLTQPILLGGAALTKKFVATECAPEYPHQVVYCRDAFTGLSAIQKFEEGNLHSTTWDYEQSSPTKIEKAVTIVPAVHIPKPTVFGTREMEVDPIDFVDLIKTQLLFRGRWGYTKGKRSKEEYQELLDSTVIPQYRSIRQRFLDERLLEPKIHYGWFPCIREKDSLIVEPNGKNIKFDFPRQSSQPCLSLVDYFNTEKQGLDVVGFFVVTVGHKVAKMTQREYEKGNYNEYLHLHGFSVEAAEALAEYTHKQMRNEIGIRFTGERYSFGYSACPDLGLQEPLLKLLDSEKIGVSLTEAMEMVPEQSVSAMVVHHSQASYFSV